MRKILAILLFLSACTTREFKSEELALSYSVEIPKRNKNQIYSHTLEWAYGRAGFNDISGPGYSSKSEGRFSRRIEMDENISPLSNESVEMQMSFTIADNRAEVVFSNPRLVNGGIFVFGARPRINMEDELAGYKNLTERVFEEYKTYILTVPYNPNFDKDTVEMKGQFAE
ncbi:MAG: hypothetical protein LBL52_00355 [Rickettsiales bacterium]|jgi:hypothetical protein|nr:hypothetical protein [Rickettsiales bacterium]